jgi:YHS domain-containing protein
MVTRKNACRHCGLGEDMRDTALYTLSFRGKTYWMCNDCTYFLITFMHIPEKLPPKPSLLRMIRDWFNGLVTGYRFER